uniref:Meteorin-like protein n=1 Tax=Xenopus tropicalis TaxID=8364 RepID=A0A803K5C9_XENTR
QINLRCMQGSLLWMYPTLALSVILEPNLANGKYSAACVRPLSPNIYVEKGDKIHLLVNEAHGTQRVTLFLLANPQKNISGRTVGFQYELLKQSLWSSSPNLALLLFSPLLLTACPLTLLIQHAALGSSLTSPSPSLTKLITLPKPPRPRVRNQTPPTTTQTRMQLLQCRVKKGPVVFLFTDSKHFGKAWLGCALRFKDFLHIYKKAKLQKYNPCEFQAD